MRCTLKKSAIYAAIAAKTFPAPVRLGNRCVAWHEAEIDGWIASRSRVKGVQ
jgi:prophage regulatory protein